MQVILMEKVVNLGSLGDVVKVKVWRDGKEMELDVTLRAAKPKE